MTNPQQQSLSVMIAISAVIILLLLCMAPAAAIGVLGAKYIGNIPPGGMDTHVVTIDIGADEPSHRCSGASGRIRTDYPMEFIYR